MNKYLRVAGFNRYIKKEIFCKILLSLCVTGTYVLQAILLSRGTAFVFAGEEFQKPAFCYLSAAALIMIRAFLVRFLEGYSKQIAGKIKTIIRELLVDKLFLLGPAYQMNKRSGKMQSLLTDGVEYLEPYLINYIPQIFIVALSVIPMIVYIFSLSVAAGVLLVISVSLAILIPPVLMPFTKRSSLGYWQQYAVLNSQYVDTMQGMNTLKTFHAEQYRGKILEDDSELFRYRQIVNTRNSLFSSAVIILMTAVGTSITTGVAAYACSDGKLGYAGLLNIMFLVIECVRPIGELNNAWHASYMGLSVANEFIEILDEPVTIQEKANPDQSNLAAGLPGIELKKVSFRYSATREQALDHVSMQIRPGETVAIVGESGSGKSTIVNLLLRFYDAQEGVVSYNGKDIRDYSLAYLRRHIAVVFQSTFLFFGTVMENIRMARPDASNEEVYEAAKAAGAHEFIMNMANGYDTIVGERGANLSGGQRQRIAIARAILKEAPVLLMDEATSSVDAATEELIQNTVRGIQGKYTTILIAHRLSTIQHADRIYVLRKGKLVETGTHEELLKKNGYYRQLVNAQNGGEK